MQKTSNTQPPKSDTALALKKPTTPHRPAAVSAPKHCYRCGGQHQAKDCSVKDAESHYCKKRGHIAKVCCTKTKERITHQLTREDEETDETGTYSVFRTCSKVTDPIAVTVVARTPDGGRHGRISIRHQPSTYQQLWPENPPPLQQAVFTHWRNPWVYQCQGQVAHCSR